MNAHAQPLQPRREPAMAFLLINEQFKSVCLGCSAILHEQGMLAIVKEVPFPRQPEYSTIIYGIADGFTLADCQAAIRDRHTGQPWGT